MDHLHEIASPLSYLVAQKLKTDARASDVPKVTVPRYTPVVKPGHADAFQAEVVDVIGLRVRS